MLSGNMVRRRVFADMSADGTNGVPDGMKVDAAGRVFCTGTGGVWVFAPMAGRKIGIIEMPEVWCANVAFGGPGPAHAVPDCQHVCVYAAGEDTGAAASLSA